MLKNILITLAYTYLTWVFFVAIMRLKELRDFGILTKESNPVVWYLGVFTLIIGLVLDFAVNMIPMTIVGLELPKESLVTQRLTRWHKSEPGHWWNRHVRKPHEDWILG